MANRSPESRIATVRVNTTQYMVLYRDFTIQEAMAKDFTTAWEWTHDNYGHPGSPHCDVTGKCQTMFECVDAVASWYEQSEGQATIADLRSVETAAAERSLLAAKVRKAIKAEVDALFADGHAGPGRYLNHFELVTSDDHLLRLRAAILRA